MDYFTLEDLNSMFINKIEYDPENKGWEFYVTHNNTEYYLKDFTLPDPENVINENIVAKVTELMLRVKNVETKEELKKKYEVIVEDFKDTPITNFEDVDYVKPPINRNIIEYNGIGGSNFFVDNLKTTKNNVHIILNFKSDTWKFGKYSKDEDWAYDKRFVNIDGNVYMLNTKPNEEGQMVFEYVEDYYSNKIEYNGPGNSKFLTDFDKYVKYNIHIILDIKNSIWYFGDYNTGVDWINKFEKRTVTINGYIFELSYKKNEEGIYDFKFLNDPSVEFNGPWVSKVTIPTIVDIYSKPNAEYYGFYGVQDGTTNNTIRLALQFTIDSRVIDGSRNLSGEVYKVNVEEYDKKSDSWQQAYDINGEIPIRYGDGYELDKNGNRYMVLGNGSPSYDYDTQSHITKQFQYEITYGFTDAQNSEYFRDRIPFVNRFNGQRFKITIYPIWEDDSSYYEIIMNSGDIENGPYIMGETNFYLGEKS
jgi:hypothetical protein